MGFPSSCEPFVNICILMYNLQVRWRKRQELLFGTHGSNSGIWSFSSHSYHQNFERHIRYSNKKIL
jgi:hypothetical protein